MSIKLDESNFQEKTSQGLVLVDFYTDWCGPCRMLAPILEKLENVTVAKVNGDHAPNLLSGHNISAYPTLIFFKEGKEVHRMVGVSPQAALQAQIDRLNA